MYHLGNQDSKICIVFVKTSDCGAVEIIIKEAGEIVRVQGADVHKLSMDKQ